MTEPARRLHPAHLTQLPVNVARFTYPREQLKTGIVHLGLGAFARAHLLAINEATLHAQQDFRWGVTGVSLRQPDTREALAPQDGLYTLACRDTPTDSTLRQQLQVVGCLRQVLVAPDNPAVVLDAIAAPDTYIVSLTVTEKGYCHQPALGDLQWDHPDIEHDLQHENAPRSAIGFIVRGLQQRRLTHGRPLTLMSLDNLPSNGHLLSKLVLGFAHKLEPALAYWIKTHCTFPNSMVDRIVPSTTQADRAAIDLALGLQDAWPVVGETFCQWIIEDRFASEHPAWDQSGAKFVASAAAWETLKLRMVNGTHSAIAYLGALAGWATVDEALTHPELLKFLETLMREEIEPTLPALPDFELEVYRQSLLARFTNKALAHRTQQIAMDGSQKIPQRWLNTLRTLRSQQKPVDKLALCLAAWIQYLNGHDELGKAYDIRDPLNEALQAALTRAKRQPAAAQAPHGLALRQTEALFALKDIFADLSADTALCEMVAQQLVRLRTLGVTQTLTASTG